MARSVEKNENDGYGKKARRFFRKYFLEAHMPEDFVRPKRNILVIVNPFSGQKKAQQLWEKFAEPVFRIAGLSYEVVTTEYKRHALEIARTVILDNYDAVAVVSGDGIISEMIAGFLMRADRERALKMPLAHIPGGTSNGLAASICFLCNEPFAARNVFCLEMALMVARPRYLPLRISHVETEHDGHKPMFMSVTWGLFADIELLDIVSERFRCVGMARLHLEAFLRIINLPNAACYKARISYIPVKNPEIKQETMLRHNAERSQFGTGHFDYAPVKCFTENEEIGVAKNDYADIFAGKDLLNGGKKLPALNEDLDEDWITVEGRFVFVCVSSVSHIGSDLPYVPSARLDDDFLYLSFVDWSLMKSRIQFMIMMLTISNSSHLTHPFLQVIPVHACRIKPLDNTGGHVAIDGEPITFGSSFQVATTKYCATVVGRNERTE